MGALKALQPFLDAATTPYFLPITSLENHVNWQRMSMGNCRTALPQDMATNQHSSQVCHCRSGWVTLRFTTLLGYGMEYNYRALLLGITGCDLRWFRLLRWKAEKEEC